MGVLGIAEPVPAIEIVKLWSPCSRFFSDDVEVCLCLLGFCSILALGFEVFALGLGTEADYALAGRAGK